MNSVSPVSTACGSRVAAIEVVDGDRDRLRRVARRFDRLQPHAPELDASPSCERRERVFRLRRGAEIDRRADAIAQLEMSGDEVGVQVRQDDVRDAQPVLGGEGDVLIDVALRIDDGRGAGRLVADEVRRVRQAIEIELMQDHAQGFSTSRQVYEGAAPTRVQAPEVGVMS